MTSLKKLINSAEEYGLGAPAFLLAAAFLWPLVLSCFCFGCVTLAAGILFAAPLSE
jgi:hypothetical protein